MSALLNFIISQNEQFQRRLASLYSDFSLQRHTNPDGYSANLAAWHDVLQKAVRAGLVPSDTTGPDILSLRTGEELLQALETKNEGRPLSLGIVIDEAVKHRRMVPLGEFLGSSANNGKKDDYIWPWGLLTWGFHQLGAIAQIPSEKFQGGRFVILSNVEEVAIKILSKVTYRSNYVDQVYSIGMFGAEAANAISSRTKMTATDLQIILTYLARDKRAIIYDNEIVKIKSIQAGSSDITAEDRTVVSLKELIAKMNREISSLSSQVVQLMDEAQNAVKTENRSSALRALRSRKTAETSLAHKIESLSQLEIIYSKIEQAVDQVTMIHTMKASTQVLRSLNAQIGGARNVEDIIEAMQNEIMESDQISNTIAEAGQGVNPIDDDTINEELEDLVKADRTEGDRGSSEEAQERTTEKESPQQLIDAEFLGKPIAPQLDRIVSAETLEHEDLLVTEGTQGLAQLTIG